MPTMQNRNGDMVDLLSTDFVKSDNPAYGLGALDSMYKGLPGLIGYWPGGMTDSNGRLMDAGANGLHMARVNTTLFNSDGLASYVKYSGAQYHTIPDTANLDILGNEVHINSAIRGLTFGAWVWPSSGIGTAQGIVSKRSGSAIASKSYFIELNSAYVLRGFIFDSTGAANSVSSPNAIDTDSWNLCLFKYTPSTSIKIVLNGIETTVTTVFSTINNSNAPFEIGRRDTTLYFNGRISRVFLCSAAVPDEYLFALYQHGRHLYGV